MKEKWASLPLEVQTDLGIELLKGYLFQPLYIRLSKEEKVISHKSALETGKPGEILSSRAWDRNKPENRIIIPLGPSSILAGFVQIISRGFFFFRKSF